MYSKTGVSFNTSVCLNHKFPDIRGFSKDQLLELKCLYFIGSKFDMMTLVSLTSTEFIAYGVVRGMTTIIMMPHVVV